MSTSLAEAAGHAADVDDAPGPTRHHAWRERRDEEERRPDVGGEYRVEGGEGEGLRGTPHREAGVVDQDVDVANLLGQTADARGIGKIGRDEAGASALRLDLFDCLRSTRGVAAMHDDVGTIARKLRGDRAAESGRGSRDERFQAMQIALLSGSHHPLHLFTPRAYEETANVS